MVADGTAAATVVGGHATNGRARRRGNVDRKPQAMRLQLAIEIVQHDAGLHRHGAAFHIQRQDAVEMLGAVDDEARIDSLSALAGATTPRGDGKPLFARQRQCGHRAVHAARHNNARRHDLIVRGIRRVTAARKGVEQHVAGDMGFQPPFKARMRGKCHEKWIVPD
jgi:hypothetical protein